MADLPILRVYTTSDNLDKLTIREGQLIILSDVDGMYYDLAGVRHAVKSKEDGSFVTLDTDQTIKGNKIFQDITTATTLLGGTQCSATAGSHAEGYNTHVLQTDSYSHTEGNNTTATGLYAHAQGSQTQAVGEGSAASGQSTVASGNYSATFGVFTEAIGVGSFAAGSVLNAGGHFCSVFGSGNDYQEGDLFEVGNGYTFDRNSGNIIEESARTYSNAFRVTREGEAIAQKDVKTESGKSLEAAESSANKVTAISESPTDDEYPSAKAVKDFFDSKPDPMVFKGTLGTDGTISELPEASASNNGFTYKVITAGTYAEQSADAGDTFISNGTSWVLIPSGDEPDGTVTNVAAEGTDGIQVTGGPITTTGKLTIKGVAATSTSMGMMSPEDKTKLDNIPESSSSTLIDDTTGTKYELGVNNGVLYIRPITS